MSCRKHECEGCIREKIAKLEKQISVLKNKLPPQVVIYEQKKTYPWNNGNMFLCSNGTTSGTVGLNGTTTYSCGNSLNEITDTNGGKNL